MADIRVPSNFLFSNPQIPLSSVVTGSVVNHVNPGLQSGGDDALCLLPDHQK